MEAEAVNHYNCIYLLRCSETNKIYIGQTYDLKQRLEKHRTANGDCTKLYRAIKKYGWESFSVEILEENIDRKEIDNLEKEYIKKYNAIEDGYNILAGGKGFIRPDGHGNMYGTGKYGVTIDNPNYQKVLREANKEKLKEYSKEYYQRPEIKERQREYHKEYSKRPEVREKLRAYYQRPDVKEKLREYHKEYYQRPEIKERQREYHKEYNQRPEVREKLREYYKRPDIKEKIRLHDKMKKYSKKINSEQMTLSAYT